MKKESKTPEFTTTIKTEWYKKASFPWLIISHMVLFIAGAILSWFVYCDQQAQIELDVQREASAIVKSLK